MELNIKNFENGDEQGILELFKLSFGKPMDIEFWKWRYQQNINNKYLIKLAMDNSQMAAHYALSPTDIFISGKKYNSAISMTTMTHPNYRGLGLFTKLADSLFEDHIEDLDVVYGVPNENSLKGFVKYLNFDLIQDIEVLQSGLEKIESEQLLDCVKIDKFSEEVDKLFYTMILKYKVILSRNSTYLNWRYIDNPQNNYSIWGCFEDNQLLGYVITKVFNGNSESVGDIVDILALNPKVFESLVSKVYDEFKNQGIKIVKIWMNDLEYRNSLMKMGFVENGEKYHFIVRNNSQTKIDEIREFQNWYVSMGDIDIF